VAALLAVEARVTRLAGSLTRLGALDMTAAPAAGAMLQDPLQGLDVVLPRRAGQRGGEPEAEQATGETGGETFEGVPDAVGAGEWGDPRRSGPDWGWSGPGRRSWAAPAGASGGLDTATPSGPAGERRSPFGARLDRSTVAHDLPVDAGSDAVTPAAPDGYVGEPGPAPRRRQDSAPPTSPEPATPLARRGLADSVAPASAPLAVPGGANGAPVARNGALSVGTDPHAALTVLRANLTGGPTQPGPTHTDAGPAPEATPPPHPTGPRPSAPDTDHPRHPSAAADDPPGLPTDRAAGTAPHQPTGPSDELVETLLDAMTDRLRLDMLRSYGTTED
jgi:hypothetical protein